MKLRVWCIINPPHEPEYYSVDTVKEGAERIDRMAEEQLDNTDVISNAFGLEIFEGDEWYEYYSPEGECVDDLVALIGEKGR